MPRTAVAAALGSASMAGMPLLFGFIAKEQFYDSVRTADLGATAGTGLLVLAVIASMCLGAAGFIVGIGPFAGRAAPTPATHEAPPAMWLGPVLLGGLGLLTGLGPALAVALTSMAAGAVTGSVVVADLVLWHGFNSTLLLSIVTIAGSIALFVLRPQLWRLSWPRSPNAERVYDGILAAGDAISRRVAPALQSASLRTYVLTVLVAAVALLSVALATGGELPVPRRWSSVQFHEVVLALIIVGSAVAAVLASSHMAAVLSLGTAGYAIAVLYALLGAPDLAMTQFAVETLTVVIFVLVFYRVRGFGDLSSRLVKARDACVAIVAGSLVTTLVLFVGASGTTSRLAAFFAETAPTQGHGRNVVNVILVDFRALDTLGEITVLVTVAVGVRALLLMGRERRP
jgi:multicomponent Na+:H+ antiporter subunit A